MALSHDGAWAGNVPLIKLRSEWHIPQQVTLTRNSPGPGSGIGNTFQRNLFGVRGEAFGAHGGRHGYSTPIVTSVDLMNTVAG